MSVSIRLTRLGGKKKPFYRIVVVDKRKKRDGDFLDRIGHYDPSREPAEIVIDQEKLQKWVGVGAQCSDTVSTLVKKVNARVQNG